MRQRRRLGIRAQLTLIVLLAALLSTGATLFVANQAIATYASNQAQEQAKLNINIALLVLRTQYGRNVSIASDGSLVADSPTNGVAEAGAGANFGKYRLDGDVDYVNEVKSLIGGYTNSSYQGYVAMYKCGSANGSLLQYNGANACPLITSTSGAQPSAANPAGANSTGTSTTGQAGAATIGANACVYTNACLPQSVLTRMSLNKNAQNWFGQVGIDGKQYYAYYTPIANPQQEVIGVIMVGIPLDAVTALQQSTAIELVLIGVIIMIAGVIFALLFASAIIATLQRAARQVSSAVENITAIATQQTGGSAQQVWAVNAINKALQTFTETARDISERTDQLALMGNQVIQRRSEIAPAQIDQILGFMTRSVRDISLATRQQVTQYERMTGAMQAVIEIAEQVANNSKEATASAGRLDTVVGQLQDLVGVRRLRLHRTGAPSPATTPALDGGAPAVRAVRPVGAPSFAGAPGPASGGVQINRNIAPVHAGGIGMRAARPGESAGLSGYPGARPQSDQHLSRAPYGGAGGSENWLGLPPLPGGGPGDAYGGDQYGGSQYGGSQYGGSQYGGGQYGAGYPGAPFGQAPDPNAGGQMPWLPTDGNGNGNPGGRGNPPW